MHCRKLTVLAGVCAVGLLGFLADASAAERNWGNVCRRGERVRIQDLDMSPDPIVEGRRIHAWNVRIFLEGDRGCDTGIEIREGRDLVGRLSRLTLRPGINEIEIPPARGYRLRGREHCFNVVVDLEGTRRNADADRNFCARQSLSWSLREPDRRGDRRN